MLIEASGFGVHVAKFQQLTCQTELKTKKHNWKILNTIPGYTHYNHLSLNKFLCCLTHFGSHAF